MWLWYLAPSIGFGGVSAERIYLAKRMNIPAHTLQHHAAHGEPGTDWTRGIYPFNL
jgi:hypothetical protein